MLPALVVFQYFLVQFAPATKGSEVSEPHWISDPHWHRATHCRARVRFSGSAASRARCPGPGTNCLLPAACCKLQPMLHFEADVASSRVASRLQRTNFGFICNFTLAEEFEEDREKEGGGKSAIWRYLWQSIIRRNRWPH